MYTCRVHGQYMAVYTSRVRGRVRAMYTTEDVRADGPYTVMYTGGVDGHGQYMAVYGPCIQHGRYTAVYGPFSWAKTCSRAVYTAVYTARTRPHNGRLHGRVRPVHGRVTAM